jgi:hypothetical protein
VQVVPESRLQFAKRVVEACPVALASGDFGSKEQLRPHAG